MSFWLFGLVVLAGLSGCGRGVPRVPTKGSIVAFDFAVTPDGAMHVVWLSRTADPYRPSLEISRTMYQRTDPGGKRWRPAMVLDPGGAEPRIVTIGNQLHVFLGATLTHYISNDGGTTWTEAVPLLRTNEYARAFDVIEAEGALVVAYISNDPGTSGGLATPDVRVSVQRFERGVPRQPLVIDSSNVASNHQVGIGLLHAEGKLHLFYIINPSWKGLRVAPPDESLPVSSVSQDQGTTWSHPTEIRVSTGSSRRKARLGAIQAVYAKGEFLVFQDPMSFYVGRPGGTWDVLPGVSTAYMSAYTSNASGAGGGSGQLFWLDYRHERMPQKLYNPLTWILIDTPSYGNNDVMSIPLSRVLDRHRDIARLRPKRWTHEMARVVAVKAKTVEGQIYVAWAGVDGALWPWQLYKNPMAFFVVKLPPQ